MHGLKKNSFKNNEVNIKVKKINKCVVYRKKQSIIITLSYCAPMAYAAKPALLLYDAAVDTLPNFGRIW